MSYGGAGRLSYDQEMCMNDAREEKYKRRIAEANKGEGAFWDLSSAGYDSNQHIKAFRILKSAYQLPGASNDTRMRLIDAGMQKLFDSYAQSESL